MDLIGGLFSLTVLAFDVWAIANIFTSDSLRKAIKFMWIGIIFFTSTWFGSLVLPRRS